MDNLALAKLNVFNATKCTAKKVHQVVWESLICYRQIEWQKMLKNLAKTYDIAYHEVVDEFDSTWCLLHKNT